MSVLLEIRSYWIANLESLFKVLIVVKYKFLMESVSVKHHREYEDVWKYYVRVTRGIRFSLFTCAYRFPSGWISLLLHPLFHGALSWTFPLDAVEQ